MSRNIWFISDTHFGHGNVIQSANRPFSSVEEMDQVMIERWNALVKPEDLVWHLGDVAMNTKYGISILRKLNGTKRLIAGNHDEIPRICAAGVFQKVRESHKLGPGVLMTHRPVVWTEGVNLHGHIHDMDPPTPQHINLSVEKIGYQPMHLDQLKELIRERT